MLKKVIGYSTGIVIALLVGHLSGIQQHSTISEQLSEEEQEVVERPSPKPIQIKPQGTTAPVKKSSLSESFIAMLQQEQYQKAVALYYDTQYNDEKLALKLRQIFINYIKNLANSSTHKNLTPQALDAYLAYFYDDVEALLLLAQYYIDNQQLYDALNSLEAAMSYAYDDKNRELATKLYREVDNKINHPQPETSETIDHNGIPLDKHNGQFIISIELTHTPVSLLIDTGASVTTLSKDTYDSIARKINSTYIKQAEFLTANGKTTGELYRINT